jgi:hypothetical protein
MEWKAYPWMWQLQPLLQSLMLSYKGPRQFFENVETKRNPIIVIITDANMSALVLSRSRILLVMLIVYLVEGRRGVEGLALVCYVVLICLEHDT